jgi:fatty acid desaturase
MAYEQQAMRGGRIKRAAMAAATAFLAINLWTGAPLIALWVGSKTSGSTVLSMQAVFVVVIVLAVLVLAMVMALAWLNQSYNALTGRPEGEHRLRWLRSMNTQGQDEGNRTGISTLEQIVMVSVYIAVIALLVWFFFFARSPLPG